MGTETEEKKNGDEDKIFEKKERFDRKGGGVA